MALMSFKSQHTLVSTRILAVSNGVHAKHLGLRSLFYPICKITFLTNIYCSNPAFLNSQILKISKFKTWNGFTAQIRSAIIRKFKLLHN